MTRTRLATTFWVALALPFLVAGPGMAGEDVVNVRFAGRVEPERVAPGGSGVLVIVGTVRKTVHVFADTRFKVTPAPADGVTYGTPTRSEPTTWKDPAFPEDPPSVVYFDRFEVRVPFTLAAAAKRPAHVGATVRWSACDEEQCYPPEDSKGPVAVDVLAPAGQPAAPEKPAAPPPEAPKAPTPPAPAPPAPTPAAPAPPPAPPSPAPPSATPPETPPAPPAAPPAPAAPPQPPPAPAAPAPAPFDVRVVHESEVAKVTVRATEKEVVVTFDPTEGYHLYAVGTTEGGQGIEVAGRPAPGIEWGTPSTPPAGEGTEVRAPYEVHLPYVDRGDGHAPLEVVAAWQGCLDTGLCRAPEPARRFTVVRRGKDSTVTDALDAPPAAVAVGTGSPPPTDAPGMEAASPQGVAPAGAAAVPEHGILFEVVGVRGESTVARWWRQLGLLIFGPVFLTGILLAFTPCVLPIIPITVSLIGGGRGDITKGRLTFLLLCYVAGLSLAFGSMGLVAALGGGSLAAAFQSPIALWAIAGLFVVLSFGMFEIYELQPPAWMQRLQGGAKGGNPAGAFLFGAIAALIASPCTGPVIAAMLVFTAQAGNALIGFFMFVVLGLGMGSVLFAAGSLNLVAKPGPWMVWVRYGFGVLLIGGALYYLASADKVSPGALFGVGFGLAVLAAVGIARHVMRIEGESPGPASARGAKVAVLLVLATGAVAFLTRAPTSSADADPASAPLSWTTVRSRAQLVAEVEKASAEGKATVVDVWATWCNYCRDYDRVIERNPAVKTGFERLHRLRIDLSDDDRPWEAGLREGLDIPPGTQPYMVFLDVQKRIRRSLDVEQWYHDKSARELEQRANDVLRKP